MRPSVERLLGSRPLAERACASWGRALRSEAGGRRVVGARRLCPRKRRSARGGRAGAGGERGTTTIGGGPSGPSLPALALRRTVWQRRSARSAPLPPAPPPPAPLSLMQRRDDPSARLGRGPGPGGARQGAPPPRRPPRGGGGRGAAAAAATGAQPPPLLPPSATAAASAAQAPAAAPTPLLPGAAVKMEPENKYLPELMAEKDSLDPSFTHAMQLLTAGTGGWAGRDPRVGHPPTTTTITTLPPFSVGRAGSGAAPSKRFGRGGKGRGTHTPPPGWLRRRGGGGSSRPPRVKRRGRGGLRPLCRPVLAPLPGTRCDPRGFED